MKFQQIVLHKNQNNDWDLSLIGLKLEEAIKIMNDVLDNQKHIFYQKEYCEWEGKPSRQT